MEINKITPLIISRNNNIKPILKEKNIQNSLNFASSDNAIKNYALSQITFKGEDYIPPKEPYFEPLYKKAGITGFMQKVYDKYASDPALYQDKKIRGNINEIIFADSDKKAEAKIELLDKFANDEKWQNNEFIQQNKVLFLKSTTCPSFPLFIDNFLSNPNLYENEKLQKDIIDEFCINQDENILKTKTKFLEKYLAEPKLHNSELINNNIADIVKNTYHSTVLDAKLQIIDNYINNEKWNTNKDFEPLFVSLLLAKHIKPDKDGARTSVIDTILTKPDFVIDENNIKIISSLIESVTTSAQAKVANKILADDFLTPNIIGVVSCTQSDIVADNKILLMDKILSEPKLKNNKDIQEELYYILDLSTYKPEEQAKARLEVIDKFLSNEDLSQTSEISDNIGKIIANVNGINTSRPAKLINAFLSDANLYQDEIIQITLPRISVDDVAITSYLLENKEKYDSENLKRILDIMAIPK